MAGLNDIIHQAALLVAASAGWTGDVKEYYPWLEAGENLPLAYVWATPVTERRHGLGGPAPGAGKKWIDYEIVVELRNNSRQPEIDEALFRSTVDAIKAKFRANQTLGGYALRFGEDIDVTIDDAVADGTSTAYRAVITSRATEEING